MSQIHNNKENKAEVEMDDWKKGQYMGILAVMAYAKQNPFELVVPNELYVKEGHETYPFDMTEFLSVASEMEMESVGSLSYRIDTIEVRNCHGTIDISHRGLGIKVVDEEQKILVSKVFLLIYFDSEDPDVHDYKNPERVLKFEKEMEEQSKDWAEIIAAHQKFQTEEQELSNPK